MAPGPQRRQGARRPPGSARRQAAPRLGVHPARHTAPRGKESQTLWSEPKKNPCRWSYRSDGGGGKDGDPCSGDGPGGVRSGEHNREAPPLRKSQENLHPTPMGEGGQALTSKAESRSLKSTNQELGPEAYHRVQR